MATSSAPQQPKAAGQALDQLAFHSRPLTLGVSSDAPVLTPSPCCCIRRSAVDWGPPRGGPAWAGPAPPLEAPFPIWPSLYHRL